MSEEPNPGTAAFADTAQAAAPAEATLFAPRESAASSEVVNLSFREASEELEGIVRLLEGNQLELEESLERYERGVVLLRVLQSRLSEAQQKVTMLLGEVELESDDSIDTILS
ncbi:MAG: exodeoxyribonuclease VII small subunit [Coriobacteriales bacterium]|jgi:exodeoxyribonuclease VII small subunit|nr:exodeoxyribonuclease VII small subunit [Coriobacteriales bacterium]